MPNSGRFKTATGQLYKTFDLLKAIFIGTVLFERLEFISDFLFLYLSIGF